MIISQSNNNNISGVYEIVNLVNGHRYIGSSADIELRLRQHRWALVRGNHINPILQNAYWKSGEKSFLFKPLLLCDPELMLYFEQLCLDRLFPEYNIAKDAMTSARGRKASEETRRKVSLSLVGNTRRKNAPTPDAMRERLREVNTGKVMPEETRAKISAALKGKKKGIRSEDHKRKLGAVHKGSTIPEEQRRKMSESQKIQWAKRKAAVKAEQPEPADLFVGA